MPEKLCFVWENRRIMDAYLIEIDIRPAGGATYYRCSTNYLPMNQFDDRTFEALNFLLLERIKMF